MQEKVCEPFGFTWTLA